MDPKPKCVIVTGRPGSGKTTRSDKLCELLHMPKLSRDEIMEGFVNSFGVSHEKLPADSNSKVTNFFFSATQMFIEAKVSVVVEAAFQHKLWEEIVEVISPPATSQTAPRHDVWRPSERPWHLSPCPFARMHAPPLDISLDHTAFPLPSWLAVCSQWSR